MGKGWCTHERCQIIELHDAHDHDFEGPIRGRPMAGQKSSWAEGTRPSLRTKPQLLSKLKPKIVRREIRADGPYAYVQCPECSGGGCALCMETGELSLYRWHLWKRNC